MLVKILISGSAYPIINTAAMIWINFILRRFNCIIEIKYADEYFNALKMLIEDELLDKSKKFCLEQKKHKIKICLETLESTQLNKKTMKRNGLILLIDGDRQDLRLLQIVNSLLGRRKNKMPIAIMRRFNDIDHDIKKIFDIVEIFDFPQEFFEFSFEYLETFKKVEELSAPISWMIDKLKLKRYL